MITGNGQVIVNQDAESQSEWVSPVVATPEAVMVINLGELDTLKISGNVAVTVNMRVPALKVQMNGASQLNLDDVEIGTLKLRLNGASSVKATGFVKNEKIDVSGASHFDGLNLIATKAAITASGSAEVVINAAQHLDVTASGASVVQFSGQPMIAVESEGQATVSHIQE